MSIENKEDLRLNTKYRPYKFSDVVGQKGALNTLKGSIRDNSIQTAYLLIGKSGSGKTTLARIFANALICKNRGDDFEPCGECETCKSFKKNPSLVDVIEIDAGSNGGIDNIRDLKESLKYTPKEAYRVVIIDEAHRLSKDGASALLKPIEEPPERTIFMLATTEADKILNTISNRCMKLVFNKLSPEIILKRLEYISTENNIEYEEDVLLNIAIGCDGSLRQAISILQQVSIMVSNRKINTEDLKGLIRVEEKYVKEILSLILNKDIVGIMNVIDEQGDSITEMDFDYFISRFRRYLYQRDIDIQTSKLISLINNTFIEYKNKSTYNVSPKTLLELSAIDCISLIGDNKESSNWLLDKLSIQEEDLMSIVLSKSKDKNGKDEEYKENNTNDIYVDINKEIIKDKAEMFKSLMEIKYRDYEYKFKTCTYEMGENKVLYFMVDNVDMKEEITGFLKREYSQSLKPICDINGFVVRVRQG